MGNKQAVAKPTECQICFEHKPPVEDKIYKNKTKAKGHKNHYFCRKCIANYILYNIRDKNANILYPGVACTATLDPIACRSLIQENYFVEWCDILVDFLLVRKGYRRAVCPYTGCSEVIVDECKGEGRQTCPKCKRMLCFGCGVAWSSDHQKICTFEEKVFLNAAKRGNMIRCPNCRYFVQRDGGCRVVKCRCGTTFCHDCGAKFNNQ